jgi:hypothetical protein
VTLAGAQGAVLIGPGTPIGNNPIRINAGGPNVGSYMADGDDMYGEPFTVTNPISTAGVAHAAPAAVYQDGQQTTMTYPTFSYVIPNLVPGGYYTVRLHFASDATGPGSTVFNVYINSTQVLSQFDVNAAAGQGNYWLAVVNEQQAIADAGGNINITFEDGPAGRANVRGIEVIPNFSLQISAGGPGTGSWAGDEDFTGGHPSAITAPVNISTAVNPAPQTVYQYKRTSNPGDTGFSYAIPTPFVNANYLVRLHFADDVSTFVGQRVFNVVINGTTVLPNFDVFGEVGNATADVHEFTVNSGTSGSILIQFQDVVHNALINGIEVLSRN